MQNLRTLKLKPGVNLEASRTLNEFQLAASNLVRYYGGLVQKLGGWLQKSLQTFVGTCRGLHGWADLIGNAYLAIGTEQRLQLLQQGSIVDITPVVQTNNPAVAFSTIINTPLVTIADGSYSPSAGDWINLPTYVSVGGLVLFGFYQVVSVTDGSHYVVNAGANASSTVTNGGAVPSYTTTNTQPTVSVVLANHGFVTGSLFNAVISTTVATVVISGIFSVTVSDVNTFTISAGSNANANTTASENAGNARIQYLLPSGPSAATALVGYGIGDYGAGDYGIGGSGQITAPGRQWSLDHFGQDLIASPSQGKIYFWVPPNASPATVISVTAPLFNIFVFVMPQAQIIISLGAEISGTLQPLLVRWCDAGDFTDWNATATNQAGSFFLSSGSTLVGGRTTGLGATIWTDTDVWSITYLGFPLVFGFNRVATACGLIAARAAGATPNFVMWLSPGLQFFQYATGGGVMPLECAVLDFLTSNIDTAQFAQVFCAENANFNEFAWHFPLSISSPLWNALNPMGYVKYNYVEQCWDFGLSSQYQRTAWTNQSPAGNPMGADLVGLIQEHEIGFDANGSAMLWSWQTGYFDLGEGEDFLFSDLLIPDFVTIGMPSFVPNLLVVDYPNATPTQIVAPAFTGATPFITYSGRGRQMSVGFSAPPSDVGTFNRLGAIRIRATPDGTGP